MIKSFKKSVSPGPRLKFFLSRLAGITVIICLYPLPGVAGQQTALSPAQNIYVGRAIVTGTDERDRPRGLAICLGEVLVNVSGDPDILKRSGVSKLETHAESMVIGLDYVDRMSGMHKHDEQGTRDRPFTLTATFDPAKIATSLASIGETPWNAPRPIVLLVVDVKGYDRNFTLVAGSPLGYDMPQLMRASVAEAAWQYKIPVTLPSSENAPMLGNMLVVHGTLVWSDADFGWIGTWRVGETIWQERGISFDAAFRYALAGVLGIASGHGPPRA